MELHACTDAELMAEIERRRVYGRGLGIVERVPNDEGMGVLRKIFPEGVANALCFVLFSTSGIHGSYCTLEDLRAKRVDSVTFLVVKPRVLQLVYGNATPVMQGDMTFLMRLRESSFYAMATLFPHRVETRVDKG